MPMPVIQTQIDQVGDTDQGAAQRHHRGYGKHDDRLGQKQLPPGDG